MWLIIYYTGGCNPSNRTQHSARFREYSVRRGMVRSIQHLRQIVRVFLLNVFGVGVSCRNLYSFVVYLNVNGGGSITSAGEERANLSAVVYL